MSQDSVNAVNNPYKNSNYYYLVQYGSFKFRNTINNDIITSEIVNTIFKIAKEFKKAKKENILVKEIILQDIIKKMHYTCDM